MLPTPDDSPLDRAAMVLAITSIYGTFPRVTRVLLWLIILLLQKYPRHVQDKSELRVSRPIQHPN